ncbi:MAG: transglycosylase SLT domain-containing protein [bacterium]
MRADRRFFEGAPLAAFVIALAATLATAEWPARAHASAFDAPTPDADPSLIDAYRSLGFRALLVEALSVRVALDAPGAEREALAAELAGELLRDGRAHDALRTLAPLRSTRWTVEFARAVALRDAGYIEAAYDAIEALADSTNIARAGFAADEAEMRDYVAYLRGTLAHAAGDVERASSLLARGMTLAETEIVRDAAERAQLWALVERGDVERAFTQICRGNSVARLGAADLVLFIAERLAASGRPAAAETLLSRAAEDFRKSASSVSAYRALEQARAARGVVPDAAFLLRGAELAEAAGAWKSAIAFARRAASVASTADARNRARRIEGIGLYSTGEFDAAARALAALRADAPSPAISRDALLFLARSERKRGREDDARAHYVRFLAEFPSDSFVEEILWDGAWEHRRAGRLSIALARFREIADRSPAGKRNDEALFQAALMRWKLGDIADAARDLERLTSRRPNAALGAQTLFFRMRLAQAAGDTTRALVLRDSLINNFRDTFYSTYVALEDAGPARAWHEAHGGVEDLAHRVAREYDAAAENEAARRWAGVSATEPARLPDARRIRRAERLLAAGLADFAEAELRLAEQSSDGGAWRDFHLALLYRSHGFPHRALAAGSRFAESRPGTRPLLVQRFLFPPAYFDVAVRAAVPVGLDPRFLLAIAREESWFEADVVSSAGAVGLAQLLPTTAERVSRQLGDLRLVEGGLTNPATNLRLGASYFAGLVREFDGSSLLAAAGYNAGEAAVAKWQPFYSPVDVSNFIESISYTETRGYVKKVLRTYWLYRGIYPTEGEAGTRAPQ